MKKKKIFGVVYITTLALMLLGILIAIISGIIQRKDVDMSFFVIIPFMIYVMIFYILGCTLGIIFLFLNCFGFFKYKKYRYLILSFLSLLWVGKSMFLWFTHGFVI